MPRGRPPKPAAAKRLAGNPGKRKPAPPSATPRPAALGGVSSSPPPEWLDLVGKAKWLELAPQLADGGHPIEADMLATYCQAWAELLLATATLNSGERTFETDKGYVGQHPAVTQQRSAMEQLRATAKLLGLSEGRRPPRPEAPVDDDYEKFIGKK